MEMMSFTQQFMKKEKTKHRIWIIISIGLMAFGTVNLSISVFAQTPETEEEDRSIGEVIAILVFENFLTIVLPIVIGAVRMGVQFARTKGLQISAEAEEYIVNQTQSFVDNQFRFMFKELKDDPSHLEALRNGTFPKELSQKALANVKTQLKKELESDEFTNVTRQMLLDNLDPLIERYVTKSKNERLVRASGLLKELSPLAVDALLLSYKTTDDAEAQKEEIIRSAINKIKKHLKDQLLLVPEDLIDTHVRADLKNKINPVSK